MTQLVAISDRFRAPQVALIRRMNKDCNDVEFDQFMHVASQLGLDPLRKQIYAFVFNKDDDDRRNMVIVIGIDGFRSVANRSTAYRPDDRAPRYTIDESKVDPDCNPLGLVSAEVTVYKFVQGAWFPITAVAYWDEFAPVVTTGDADDYEWVETGEVWPDTGKPKKRKQLRKGSTVRRQLDPKKDAWRKMPRIMLAKCCEANAIRRGWPEDLSTVYSDEEIDRARTLDLTATEIAETAAVDRRLAMINGGATGIMFDMGDGLERIELGKAADLIIGALRDRPAHEVIQWRNVNRVPLQEFWARAKADALGLKQWLEGVEKKMEAEIDGGKP